MEISATRFSRRGARYGKMTLLGIQLGKKQVFLTIHKNKRAARFGKMTMLEIQMAKKHVFLMIGSKKTPYFARFGFKEKARASVKRHF